MASTTRWRFWIDTGGTFTDCLAQTPGGELRRLKVLSTGAVRGEIAAAGPLERVVVRGLPPVTAGFFAGYELRGLASDAVWRVRDSMPLGDATALTLDQAGGVFAPRNVVDLSVGEEAPVLAMRVLTGTRLAARLPPAELRLATTRGTNALLEGKGARVAFFVTEGFGDLLRIGDQRRTDLFALCVKKPPPLHGPVVEVNERLAADGTVVRALDLAATRAAARTILDGGVTVAAVALLHSDVNPGHERAVAALLRELGFSHVSVSSDLAPFVKILPRAETTVVDAMLAPVMDHYLSGVATAMEGARFFVMTSAGGLVRRDAYRPKDSLLSGPAGGVAGAAAVARRAGLARVLTFDMGGTSTDVARWEGDFDYRFQHAVGAARVFAPAVRVESVAAGGGSVCRFDGAAFVVGPESAGAFPGPACYGGGGPLTLTDVNLLLGRLDVVKFALPVSVAAAEAKLATLLSEVRARTGAEPSRREVLQGFLTEIANERMAEAIRRISVYEGYDPAEHALVVFGGAGGLHGCAVAERLGMRRLLFPGDSGLLSAAGLRDAIPERFAERQVLAPLVPTREALPGLLARLETEARAGLAGEVIPVDAVEVRRAELELRCAGQESTLVVAAHPLAEIEARFRAAHEARYGYVPAARAIEVVSARVVVSTAPVVATREDFAPTLERATPDAHVSRGLLAPGEILNGPVLVADEFSTLFIAPGWRAVVGSAGSLLMEHMALEAESGPSCATEIDLELFTCRFMALVEKMGGLLQRCAVSVNVKERLDFSCALLDVTGQLVANAPHIPVHLGALGLCVRRLRESIAMDPGDVVVTNHPAFGGSHLPDVTVIAPVHDAAGVLLGYVANRAHHAEIGGLQPGSMSPQARRLIEEGVVIAPMYLVHGGVARWEAIRELLAAGRFPSRGVDENVADLHAQLAAVRQGVVTLRELSRVHGRARVHEFMARLQSRAAAAVAAALARLPAARWEAIDALDDGTPVRVRCEWTKGEARRLRVDFAGSGDVHPGNLNATPAIVRSATLYVLRVLAGVELPLNEGLMRDVDLVVPVGLLAPEFSVDPAACPAVAGGNVETSQRIVDVLMCAFGLAACSQGTMNNVVFGSDRLSYYETIGGGTGAGPGFAGCDAVHSHMTNTAITDPEVMERRLALRVERFAVRRDSGGAGKFPGGAGIERCLRFLAPFSLSLLTQRRHAGPPGLAHGEPGRPGSQWIERVDGRREELRESAQADVRPGDMLVVQTPGGGGWGVCS